MDLIVKVKETCSFDIRQIKGHSDNRKQRFDVKYINFMKGKERGREKDKTLTFLVKNRTGEM